MGTTKTPVTTLETLDLSPMGETLVSLHQNAAEIQYRAGEVGCYSSRAADYTEEKGREWRAARMVVERAVNRATKARLLAFLEAHGVTVFAGERGSYLKTRAMSVIHDANFPVRVVDAAPNDFVCPCGHRGPAMLDRFGHTQCGAACDRPKYALQLVARIERMAADLRKAGRPVPSHLVIASQAAA